MSWSRSYLLIMSFFNLFNMFCWCVLRVLFPFTLMWLFDSTSLLVFFSSLFPAADVWIPNTFLFTAVVILQGRFSIFFMNSCEQCPLKWFWEKISQHVMRWANCHFYLSFSNLVCDKKYLMFKCLGRWLLKCFPFSANMVWFCYLDTL